MERWPQPATHMSSQLIYRYRPPSRVDELLENYLWFSHWSQLNDPYEFFPSLDFRPEDHVGPRGNTDSQTYELALMVASSYVPDQHLRRFRDYTSGLGVCCFSRDPGSLLMWSHYAGAHKGFVLGFDASHEFFRERDLPVNCFPNRRDVAYVTERPRVALRNLTSIHSISQVVFTKPAEWRYESEVRLLQQIRPDKQRIPFPLDALKEVIVGFHVEKSLAMRMHREVSKRAPWVRWDLSLLESDRFKLARMPLPISTDLGHGAEMIVVSGHG
jgi:hypothetical protein